MSNKITIIIKTNKRNIINITNIKIIIIIMEIMEIMEIRINRAVGRSTAVLLLLRHYW